MLLKRYTKTECQVVHGGKLTESIQISSSVKQGCILSPVTFILVLAEW
jgi:hypothetical protein